MIERARPGAKLTLYRLEAEGMAEDDRRFGLLAAGPPSRYVFQLEAGLERHPVLVEHHCPCLRQRWLAEAANTHLPTYPQGT